ncbi:MAG: hypothetical protein EZS28_008798 [Streblomastix strix]|uniref:Uncharacterized protein n=1 Tax=Streblomastix strix TaxID=222440 RepID=A0A5J4WMS9_9EUKA|nr:MAG: hypothetical protein EZS28_008798 [Streblomastix strix]
MKENFYEIALQIRTLSFNLLSNFHWYGDKKLQQLLISDQFARIIVQLISICGGIGEYNTNRIEDSLSTISQLLTGFRGTDIMRDYLQPESELLQITIEEIEDEGGQEEVDANQFHMKGSEDEISDNAKWVMIDLINSFKDISN